MATKKQFVDGKPAPVTPQTNEQKVQDMTPGQQISSDDADYDENEHGDDIAALKNKKDLDTEDKVSYDNR